MSAAAQGPHDDAHRPATTTHTASADTTGGGHVPVWDRLVRVLHLTLITSLGVTSASLVQPLGLTDWHQAAGTTALAAAVVRITWGFVGHGHARFASFVRSPRRTWRYVRLLRQRREPHLLGHNPLGAWMILALLGSVVALAFTGWLYTTDALWGNETVEDIHRALAWGLLGLVALHVAGVIFTSRRQHENLVAAMIHGHKIARDERHRPDSSDAPHLPQRPHPRHPPTPPDPPAPPRSA